VQNKDRIQLYDLLDSHHNNQQGTEKIYEISFVSDVPNTEESPDNDNGDRTVDNIEKESKDIVLIYWPVQNGQHFVPPLRIVGTYEDNSSDLYYLTLPLAFTGDVAIATIALTAFLICPTCFAE
jgi:hypothetical protein